MTAQPTPRGVSLSVAFFVLSGLLELGAGVSEMATLRFWPLWEAVGRGLLHVLLALGLRHRFAFCRTIAMIYCLATLLTYGAALGLALARFPIHAPPSVVLLSAFQVPSCALLLPYLRTAEARAFFTRPLFGR